MNLEEIREIVMESVEAVKDQGMVIRPGSYGVRNVGGHYICEGPGCCALSAVALHKKIPVEHGIAVDIASYLGVTPEQVESFTHGFDYTWRERDDKDMRKLGEDIAKVLGCGPGWVGWK